MNILNPLANPLFVPVITRAFWTFLIGFVLILILNKGFTGLWQHNVGKRYLSWLWIWPLYAIAIFLGGTFSLLFLIIVLIAALWEAGKIAKLPQLYVWVLYVLAAFSVFVASQHTQLFYTLPVAYFMFATTLAIRENNAKKSFINASVTLLISIWVIFSLTHFVLLGHLDASQSLNRSLLLLVGFMVPLSDICAYVVGSTLTKRNILTNAKIASNISPQKTWGGVLGNILGVGIGISLLWFAVKELLPLWLWVALAIVLGIINVFGDLTESMFKREYGVKDSSNLIPGHGGVLDRIDSTLRVIIVLYYFLLFFL